MILDSKHKVVMTSWYSNNAVIAVQNRFTRRRQNAKGNRVSSCLLQLHIGISQVTLTHHPAKRTRRRVAGLFEHPGLDWWGGLLPLCILRSAGATISIYAGCRNCYSKSNMCDRCSKFLFVMPRDIDNKGKRKYIWKYGQVCYLCMRENRFVPQS